MPTASFVKINAAFNEGMDVVNALAQKYADDNDVHNEPLQ